MEKRKYNTVWISDVHLGTHGCRAEELRAFLKSFECKKLYLVGDIIDGWVMSRKWFWPSSHTNVVRQVLGKAEKADTEVVYISGNHDEFLRDLVKGKNFTVGNVKIVHEDIHVTANGEKLWVVHGDNYDILLKSYHAIGIVGDVAYEGLLWINKYYDIVRRRYGWRRFSAVNFFKKRFRMIEKFITMFEEAVAKEAVKRNFDGVITGHIHRVNKKEIEGVTYWNCGDWVESCTALVENEDGTIEAVEWVEDFDKNGEIFYRSETISKF